MSSDEIEDVSDHFSNSSNHHRSHSHQRQIGDSSAGGSGRFVSARNRHHRRHSGTSATLTAMVAAARVDAERKVFAVRRVTATTSSTALVVERTPSARWAHAASQGDADSDFGVPIAQLPLQRPSLPPSSSVVVVHDDDDDDDDVVPHSDSSGWISAPRSGTRFAAVTVLSSQSSPPSSLSSSSSSSHQTPAAKRRAISTPHTQSVVRHRSGASSMYVPVSPFATPSSSAAARASAGVGIPFDAIGSPSPDNFDKSRVTVDVVVDDDDVDDNDNNNDSDEFVDHKFSNHKRSSVAVAGDDIEDVSDAVLELKARSHPRSSQLFGSRAKLPVVFAADTDDAVVLHPTPMRRVRRTHAERVASANACTDARVLFWSHSSAAAVERAARGDHGAAMYAESLGAHRRVATYTRYVDVCNAVVVEIAVADDALVCTLVSSRGVRCQLAISLAVDASIREQMYSLQEQARNATWRRLECDEAQLVNIDDDAAVAGAENKPCKPYILYSVSWCDASVISVSEK